MHVRLLLLCFDFNSNNNRSKVQPEQTDKLLQLTVLTLSVIAGVMVIRGCFDDGTNLHGLNREVGDDGTNLHGHNREVGDDGTNLHGHNLSLIHI